MNSFSPRFRPSCGLHVAGAALAAAITLFVASCAGAPVAPDSTEESTEMTPIPAVEKSPVSGLPVPAALLANPLLPAGEDLAVLDWAGFEASATYSYDDGQPSHIAHWEALKETGVPMTWYLMTNSNWPAGYDATWKDALANGHELGNHTHTHNNLVKYADSAAIVADLDSCETYLRDRLGQEGTPSFAYPFGETGWKEHFDKNADGSARDASRFLFARTVQNGRIGPRATIDPLFLPIFGVTGSHREADFIRELDAALAAKSWTIFMYHSILPGDNWYAGVPLEDVLGSLDHARRGQKMWLDTVLSIASYWYAARLVRSLEPVDNADGQSWTWPLPAAFPGGRYLRVSIPQGSLWQGGRELAKHEAGFYEIALDEGTLLWKKN